MIKVIIVDDQGLVREGIATLLTMSGEFDIIATAENGHQALTSISENPDVDIVLMDIRMPEMSGLEAVRKLRAQGNNTPVLLLTTFDEPNTLGIGKSVGANGYLLKDAKVDDLIETIHQVLSGLPAFPNPDSYTEHQSLTQKEHEVLKSMVAGKSNREIAEDLHLSLGTIKNYNSNIFAKLGVKSRTQAVVIAKQLGLA